MFRNTNFLSYYKTASSEMSDEQIIKIISAICSTYLPEPSAKQSREIVEFVEFFKKKNESFFIHNQDLLVFKLYAEIIRKSVEKQQNVIHNKLSKEQQNYATDFVNQIFSLNIELVCVASAQGKTYMRPAISFDELISITEYLLFCKNAVLLFYGKAKNQIYTFGFTLKEGIFSEIDAKNLKNISSKKDENYTTFSNLKSMIA